MEKELGKHHKCMAIVSLLMSSTLILFAASNASPALATEQTTSAPAQQQAIQTETPLANEASNTLLKSTSKDTVNAANSASPNLTTDSATGATNNQEQGADTSPESNPTEPPPSPFMPTLKAKPLPTLPTQKMANPSQKTVGHWSTVPGIGSTTALTRPKAVGNTSTASGITLMPKASCKWARSPHPMSRFGTPIHLAP